MEEYFFGKTYIMTEELQMIRPLLTDAMAYQKRQPGYLIPYSYWTDKKGWLYIRWSLEDDLYIRPVWRYSYDDDGKLQAEKIPVNVSGLKRFRGKDQTDPAVFITGDTHGSFDRIARFCRRFQTNREDVLIILGDAGINYYGDYQDTGLKDRLSKLDITLFCIHGNHELRPEAVGSYSKTEWHGGQVYVEAGYPNLIFAVDGEVYDIAGRKTIVIGGAYSLDKYLRLERGYKWFSDEQPSEEIKRYVESQLDQRGWQVDIVLSHTVPYKYRPVDHFMQGVDQSTVDESTELWLDGIEERLTYKGWYAGHFHCDRAIDRLTIMYEKVELFGFPNR